jgi:hypothetical protein
MDGQESSNDKMSTLQVFQQGLLKLEDDFEKNANRSTHQNLAPIAEKPTDAEVRKRGGFSIRALLN